MICGSSSPQVNGFFRAAWRGRCWCAATYGSEWGMFLCFLSYVSYVFWTGPVLCLGFFPCVSYGSCVWAVEIRDVPSSFSCFTTSWMVKDKTTSGRPWNSTKSLWKMNYNYIWYWYLILYYLLSRNTINIKCLNAFTRLSFNIREHDIDDFDIMDRRNCALLRLLEHSQS